MFAAPPQTLISSAHSFAEALAGKISSMTKAQLEAQFADRGLASPGGMLILRADHALDLIHSPERAHSR